MITSFIELIKIKEQQTCDRNENTYLKYKDVFQQCSLLPPLLLFDWLNGNEKYHSVKESDSAEWFGLI